MELVRIPIQELDKVWGVVEKDIKNALAYSSQLTDFVYDLLKDNKFQLWYLGSKQNLQQQHGCCSYRVDKKKALVKFVISILWLADKDNKATLD